MSILDIFKKKVPNNFTAEQPFSSVMPSVDASLLTPDASFLPPDDSFSDPLAPAPASHSPELDNPSIFSDDSHLQEESFNEEQPLKESLKQSPDKLFNQPQSLSSLEKSPSESILLDVTSKPFVVPVASTPSVTSALSEDEPLLKVQSTPQLTASIRAPQNYSPNKSSSSHVGLSTIKKTVSLVDDMKIIPSESSPDIVAYPAPSGSGRIFDGIYVKKERYIELLHYLQENNKRLQAQLANEQRLLHAQEQIAQNLDKEEQLLTNLFRQVMAIESLIKR